MMNGQSDSHFLRLTPAIACVLLCAAAVFLNPSAPALDDQSRANRHENMTDRAVAVALGEVFHQRKVRDDNKVRDEAVWSLSSPEGVFRVLRQALRDAGQDAEFVAASAEELNAVTVLFTETLSRDSGFEALRNAWKKWKMELLVFTFQNQELWLLSESPDARRGRGVYIFRQSQSLPVMLQAPHSGFDQYTDEIVARLFAENSIPCAAWNSVGREQIDFAHSDANYFQSLTRAVGESFPKMLVVQIHGFDERKRETGTGRDAWLIASNGSAAPPGWFLPAALVFEGRFPDQNVAVFPFEITELGATTNLQARLLRSLSNYAFLHLECNRSCRQTLLSEVEARHELAQCLHEFIRMKGGNVIPY